MSSWPLAGDFSAILQNPEIAFRDTCLKQVQIATYPNTRQPVPLAGAFAVVFKGTRPDGREIAIRPFTSQASERQERYSLVHAHLSKRNLSCLVDFEYDDKAIRSPKGGWFPLVVMEWVSGGTLFKYLHEKCLQADKKSLAKLADKWVDLVDELRDAEVAHGDLQHANVMVTDKNELKLVDYDGMYVPSMGNNRVNLELGVVPYQHPERSRETRLSLGIDSFSTLFILVVLKALAAKPELWQTYVENTGYDKILIQEEDFQSPTSSGLYRELLNSPDSDVVELTHTLFELYRSPIDDVPPLQEVLNSWGKVEVLLGQRDWDAAIERLKRGQPKGRAPHHLPPLIQQARDRVTCRIDLEKAVARADENAMAQLYTKNRHLLDDYPAAQSAVVVAKDSPQAASIIRQLEDHRQANQWRQFIQVWDTNHGLLSKRKSAQIYQQDVQKWRELNDAWDAVRKDVDACHYAGLVDVWKQLKKVESRYKLSAHPESQSVRKRIERLILQFARWSKIEEISLHVNQQNDLELDTIWDDQLFAEWDPAIQNQARIDEARGRIKILNEMAQRIEQCNRSPTLSAERSIVKSNQRLPSGYVHDKQKRVITAGQRIEAADELVKTFPDPASDLHIYEAWECLSRLGGESLVSHPQARARIELAKSRYSTLDNLRKLPANLLPDQLDQRLLAIWQGQELTVADCPDVLRPSFYDALSWKELCLRAAARRELLDRIESAIAVGNESEISQLAQDPLLKDYPLPEDWQKIIGSSQSHLINATQLLDAVNRNDRVQFQKQFNVGIIQRFSHLFDPVHDKLLQMVQSEMTKVQAINLRKPFFDAVQQIDSTNRYRIGWSWPTERFTDTCVLAVCRQKPSVKTEPEEWRLLRQWRIVRKMWEGNQIVELSPGWNLCYAVVWVVINLGPDYPEIRSEPLLLGQLKSQIQSTGRHGMRAAL